MPAFSETDLAYAAGIIDGEGCICIFRTSYGTKSKLPQNYALTVGVLTTDTVIAPWLHATFGGSLRTYRHYGASAKVVQRGLSRRWMVASAEAESFLRAIFPYLKLKQHRAEVALRFRGLVSRTGHAITEENRAQRLSCYEEMRELNRRGVWDKVA